MAFLNRLLLNCQYASLASKWQKRAEFIHRTTNGDCDEVTSQITKEMIAEGLEVGKDFVAMRKHFKDGKYKGQRHVCLDMHGHRIDGVSPKLDMSKAWVGKYAKYIR